MTKKQIETIRDNLRAYKNNFGYIRIENADYGTGFYVYTSADKEANYIQYCYNIDYLNGWLYGAVQAANGVMKKIDYKEIIKALENVVTPTCEEHENDCSTCPLHETCNVYTSTTMIEDRIIALENMIKVIEEAKNNGIENN